ncbi:hypothetical protein ACU4GD_39125 [Cupriavidus basilensis]
MLYDVTSGQALASQNADARIEPASLTKLMTAYLAFAAINSAKKRLPRSTVTVVPTTPVLKVKSDESRMFLEPNKPVSVRDLLLGLIACSRAATPRWRWPKRSAAPEEGFPVAMMRPRSPATERMKNTHFTNTDGTSPTRTTSTTAPWIWPR